MAYTVEYSPLMDGDDVKRTMLKLHTTFMFLSFMSINQVLKIVITNADMAEVYAKNGNIYYYEPCKKYNDRLEQVRVKAM